MLRQISSLTFPTQVLYGYPQSFFKTNRIHNMPSVQTKAFLCVVKTIRFYYLWKSGVRSRKHFILMRFSIFEIVRAAEIIFSARAINSGIFLITINVKLDLAFAPPPIIGDAPGQISSHILSFSLYVIH